MTGTTKQYRVNPDKKYNGIIGLDKASNRPIRKRFRGGDIVELTDSQAEKFGDTVTLHDAKNEESILKQAQEIAERRRDEELAERGAHRASATKAQKEASDKIKSDTPEEDDTSEEDDKGKKKKA